LEAGFGCGVCFEEGVDVDTVLARDAVEGFFRLDGVGALRLGCCGGEPEGGGQQQQEDEPQCAHVQIIPTQWSQGA
jgi:hypothetical protein